MMTADALRLAEGYVQVRSLGPVNVKGMNEPVEVHEVTGTGLARSRLQAAAARGILTRFVGRDGETQQLRKALEQARGDHGQVVGEQENLVSGSHGCSSSSFHLTSNPGVADPRKRLGLLWQSHTLFADHRSAQSLL